MRLALLETHRPAAGGLSPARVQAAGELLLGPSWSADCPAPRPAAPSPLGLSSTGGPLIFQPLLTDPGWGSGPWDVTLSAQAPEICLLRVPLSPTLASAGDKLVPLRAPTGNASPSALTTQSCRGLGPLENLT